MGADKPAPLLHRPEQGLNESDTQYQLRLVGRLAWKLNPNGATAPQLLELQRMKLSELLRHFEPVSHAD